MPRSLTLRDLNTVRELQTQGLELDFERTRLWPHSPLTAALAGQVPFSEIGALTFVLYQNGRKKQPLGVIQCRQRRNRPEADITFIAPALDLHPEAVTIWYRLLAEATNQLGELGCQRVYVQVPDDSATEEVFRTAGFSTYSHEDIYRLSAAQVIAHRKTVRPRRLRRQRKRDAWNLLRLYNSATPRPVQQAEGMVSSDGNTGKVSDWWTPSGTGYVLESDGELIGAARITRGRKATWLRLYLHPGSETSADDMMNEVLGLLRAFRPRPVYCAVRDYEGGIRGALEATGFEFVLRRSLMVKHTTVRIKEPVPWLAPVLENPVQAIQSRINAREKQREGELQIT